MASGSERDPSADVVVTSSSKSWAGVLVGTLMVLVLVALILPGVQQSREAARRTMWKHGLREVGLALHSYHEAHNTLPPGGVFRTDGTPCHEWTSFLEVYMAQVIDYLE